MWSVEDLNIKHGRKKTHQIKFIQANGKGQLENVTFHGGTPSRMTQERALIFLEIDPMFRVRNSKGQIVRPRKWGEGQTRTVTLKPHEIVVPITAVLKEHLWQIVIAMPGGSGHFKEYSATPRADIEEFIISGGVVAEPDDDSVDMVEAPAAAVAA